MRRHSLSYCFFQAPICCGVCRCKDLERIPPNNCSFQAAICCGVALTCDRCKDLKDLPNPFLCKYFSELAYSERPLQSQASIAPETPTDIQRSFGLVSGGISWRRRSPWKCC